VIIFYWVGGGDLCAAWGSGTGGVIVGECTRYE
jgi:hypothetical protein